MNFYINISKTANSIAGLGLVAGIGNEILHKMPHIEMSDYWRTKEVVPCVVSGFVETMVIREVVLPNLLNPNFLNSFRILRNNNLDPPTTHQGNHIFI